MPEQIELKRMIVEYAARLRKEELAQVGITQVMVEDAVDAMILKVRRSVWGEELSPIIIEYPATWWDHVKRDLLRMKKYRLKTVRIDPKILYPNMKVAVPETEHYLRMVRYDGGRDANPPK
jgi:hypothetical protein